MLPRSPAWAGAPPHNPRSTAAVSTARDQRNTGIVLLDEQGGSGNSVRGNSTRRRAPPGCRPLPLPVKRHRGTSPCDTPPTWAGRAGRTGRADPAVRAMNDRLPYDNPLITRYASRKMAELWGPQRKHGTWRRLWLALAEAQHELGLTAADGVTPRITAAQL